ncbi:restriction endonuclease subunit S [Streptomyces nodosus]|uniref:Restriction endonuclease subunit S n=1 Tax=Streptomyces nodosus TaxID=40318 RepID=A0A0B5DQ66_9ACTN|nr:hypothetical protein SNOD_28120 [Streptomyces nodosus]QEV41962.1 restriction endonuclease subunit S [Streptomyces nodosus]
MRSAPIIGDFKSRSKGIRPAQWRLYWDDLAQVRIDLPLLEEQRRIAEFLDAETIRIDRVLELRSELAARLIERDNALRDGLLDRLFESTDTIPLRRFITRIEQGDSPQCEAVPRQTSTEWGILKLSSVRHGQFDPDENKRLPDHLRPNRSYSVGHGDFLVTRANTPNLVGDVAVVTEGVERLLLPDLIYRVRLTDSVSADFVAQVALGRRTRSLIESVARGTSQSMVKLRGEDIKTWPIPSATKDQQDKFVSIIAHRTAASARLRSLVDRQAKLLAERRQALITAAVTGQFDVSAASGRNVTEGVSA